MRLCWRRAAAMWYRDDGVSPLGSCGNKKHQMNMITDSDLVQEKGEQTQLCNIMFTMCKRLLFYSFRVFDHSRFLLLLFIWKKVMTENSTWHSSHLVWVSEYYSMITWTRTKGSYQNSCHANWYTLHSNDKCSETMTGNISEILPSTGCVSKPNMSNLKAIFDSTFIHEGQKWTFNKRRYLSPWSWFPVVV